MFYTTLTLYVEAFFITAVLALVASVLYLLGYMARGGQKKTLMQRQNKILDVLLVDVLTIPVVSFAILALIVTLKSR
ncbi:DUF4059 family protein [Streptococcaceae bacterium ESL0687]|nr:DUF4059 family protein [Streptococcaceae bacterium ESL0687]